MSEPKEPSFFSRRSNLSKLDEYGTCFSYMGKTERTPKIFGEATTAYMVESYVPQRIKNTLGTDLKFIFVLRNPVERTISAYWHLYKRLDETRSIREVLTFDSDEVDSVIEQEGERIQTALKKKQIRVDRYQSRYDDYIWPFYYIRNSLYSRHLSRFAEYFDRKSMLFIFTEELAEKPEKVFHQVEQFLGIDDTFMPDTIVERYNKTIIPRRGRWVRWLHSIANYVGMRKGLVEYKVFDEIYTGIFMKKKPRTDDDIKEGLKKIFINEQERLSEMLNVDISKLWL